MGLRSRTARRSSAALGAAALAVVLFSSPSTAAADEDRLEIGESLGAGESLVSPGGSVVLVVRARGDVALFGADGTLSWTSGGGVPGSRLEVAEDGDVRLVAPDGTVTWRTGTVAGTPGGGEDTPQPEPSTAPGLAGARLVVEDDGDLVVQDTEGTVLWESGTGERASRIDPGGSIAPGGPLTSPDGRHVLLVRRTGNVVLLGPDSLPRWSTATEAPGSTFGVSADGDLTVTGPDGETLWTTRVAGVPGSTLVLQDDGDLVLYGPDRAVLWRSGTGLGPATLSAGEALESGEHLDAADGHLRLALDDETLRLTYDDTELWTSPEPSGPGARLTLADSGDLVLTRADGTTAWHSDSAGADRAALRLEPTGIVLAAASGQELWRVDVPEEVVVQAPVVATDCTQVDGPVPIDATVVTADGLRVHACLAASVEAMFAAARADGVELGGSGWRSHEQQVALRAKNCRGSGEDARCTPPTAVPGNSRHERGLALDLTSDGRGIRTGTPAWSWLVEHAPEYGFENLPGEPWHWSVDGH